MAGLGALIIFLLCAPLTLSGGMPGGWQPADKNSQDVQDIAESCVSHYNQQSNYIHLVKMISIEDAFQQVVSGMNYNLTIVMVQTDCKKGSPNNSSCSNPSASKCVIVKCVFLVYDVPLKNHRNFGFLLGILIKIAVDLLL